MRRWVLTFGLFGALIALLAAGLRLNPRELPSPLVDKPAPGFRLPQLHDPQRGFSPDDARGRVWVMNVWASWCVSCRDEHPLLLELARAGVVPVYGLNYKDRPNDARAWLRQFGDPYQLSVTDIEGRVGIDYGVYGVPETYVIDRSGVIRYKHIGPVTRDVLERKILPMVRRLEG